jgi:antitoxin component of MazEF toxin-antitoxin module
VLFSAEVHSAGRGGRAVVVPAEVTAALSSRKVAVRALVNGVEHRSRLAVHAGRTYLGLPAALLRQLGVGAGDTVEVDLEEQPEPVPAAEPEVAEAAELTAMLDGDPVARAGWSALSPAAQQEYHRWVAGTDEPAARSARVARLRHRLLRQR